MKKRNKQQSQSKDIQTSKRKMNRRERLIIKEKELSNVPS